MSCRPPSEMVEERINRVLTQYRESPRLLFLLRTYLSSVANLYDQVCDLPEKFDLDTAVGDQLTLVGKRMGWPRSHCVCDLQPVFGFDCNTATAQPVLGFCDDQVTWDGCNSSGIGQITIADDELYRKFLKVRRYQIRGLFDLKSLETCLRVFFGDQAGVILAGQGRVVIAPGRDLDDAEIALLQLYPRVLPIALGVQVRFHFGSMDVFGFGEGWGGFCDPVMPTDASYQRTKKLFGFCGEDWTEDDIGGFCENWDDNPQPLISGDGEYILTQDEGVIIVANNVDGITGDHASWLCHPGSDWLCEIDVQPYSC